jgi:hypothetical protein
VGHERQKRETGDQDARIRLSFGEFSFPLSLITPNLSHYAISHAHFRVFSMTPISYIKELRNNSKEKIVRTGSITPQESFDQEHHSAEKHNDSRYFAQLEPRSYLRFISPSSCMEGEQLFTKAMRGHETQTDNPAVP